MISERAGLPWLAGYFEADGSVTVLCSQDGGRHYHSLMVSVKSVDRDSLSPFHAEFGGKIIFDSTSQDRGHQFSKAWMWYAYSGTAERALQMMLPYFQLHRKTLAAWFSLKSRHVKSRFARGRSGLPRRKLADDEVTMEHEFHELIKQVNSRPWGDL